MSKDNGISTIQQIIELLNEQRELLRGEEAITPETVELYRERFFKIRELMKKLSEEHDAGGSRSLFESSSLNLMRTSSEK